jgi:hypothetical protein
MEDDSVPFTFSDTEWISSGEVAKRELLPASWGLARISLEPNGIIIKSIY